MALLQQLIPLVVMASLAGLIASVGMDSTLAELLSLFRRPAQLAKAVLAVNVIVPAAAVVLVLLIPLAPLVRGAILVMAVSPVPPLVPGKAAKVSADKAYAYSLYTALALLSVAIVPATVALMERLFDATVPLGLLAVARNVFVSVILPLAAGLLLRRLFPHASQRLSPLLRRVAFALLLLALIPLLAKAWPGIAALAGDGTLAAMAAVAAIGLAAGHLLGGPSLQDRGALAVAASTRHPGIALMIANAAGTDRRIVAAILAFLLVGLVVSIPYQIWMSRRDRAAA
jgi:BASS family bile acid:Na+ symporter